MIARTVVLIAVLSVLAVVLTALHRRAARIDRERAARAERAQPPARISVVPGLVVPEGRQQYFRHVGESLRIVWDAYVRDASPESLANGLARVAHRGASSLILGDVLPELATLFSAVETRLASLESRGTDGAELENARTELERLVNTVRMLAHQ